MANNSDLSRDNLQPIEGFFFFVFIVKIISRIYVNY